MRRVGLALLLLSSLTWLGLSLWLPPKVRGAPHFVIEHAIDFAGTPHEVWAVLMDADAYAEWNPYLLDLSGTREPGGQIEIEILQDNWDEPMRLTQTVVDFDPPRLLHWRGSLRPAGLMQTDHSFRIEEMGEGAVRFVHREEFRGLIAELMDEETRSHTARAFRAMDEALAARVAWLRTNGTR